MNDLIHSNMEMKFISRFGRLWQNKKLSSLIWKWDSPVDMIQYDKTWNYQVWYGNLAHRWIWSATLSASRCWLEGWLAPHTGSEKRWSIGRRGDFLCFTPQCVFIFPVPNLIILIETCVLTFRSIYPCDPDWG